MQLPRYRETGRSGVALTAIGAVGRRKLGGCHRARPSRRRNQCEIRAGDMMMSPRPGTADAREERLDGFGGERLKGPTLGYPVDGVTSSRSAAGRH